MKKVLKSVYNYMVFFCLVAFVTTCSTMLFVSTMRNTMGINLTGENLNAAAKITLLNVMFLSFIYTLCDTVRRKITVERPVKKICHAAEKIIQGDFSVRIPKERALTDNGFDRIIDCFNKMAEELSGTQTLRNDFISNVSHELKTPLAVMKNYADMLLKENIDENDRIEYAKIISNSANKLADLVTNILKLNKLENQQIFPEKKKYNLSEQLCECLLGFEPDWEKKEINIKTDIEEDVFVETDSELLSLVWNNLFSNAVKFTPKGGTVALRLYSDGDFAYVSVADTGCGISQKVGEHIFEKFYQGDASHNTEGNGLGLALVKRVVDITGSEIQVKSELGKGSVFSVKVRRFKQ